MYKLSSNRKGCFGLVACLLNAEVSHRLSWLNIDGEKINLLRRGISPIYEAGLEELIKKNYAAGRLNCTTE